VWSAATSKQSSGVDNWSKKQPVDRSAYAEEPNAVAKWPVERGPGYLNVRWQCSAYLQLCSCPTPLLASLPEKDWVRALPVHELGCRLPEPQEPRAIQSLQEEALPPLKNVQRALQVQDGAIPIRPGLPQMRYGFRSVICSDLSYVDY
jgi:hypothetical protein